MSMWKMMSIGTLTLPKVVVTQSKEVKGGKAAVHHRICARSAETVTIQHKKLVGMCYETLRIHQDL